MKSDDDGLNWSYANFNDKFIINYEFIDDKIFIASEKSLWLSIDKGNKWEEIKFNDGTNFTKIFMLKIDSNKIYISDNYKLYEAEIGIYDWKEIAPKNRPFKALSMIKKMVYSTLVLTIC